MALVVTPGGAVDDSLATLAELAAYAAAFGHDISAFSEAEKEVSLRRMTLWVEGLGSRSQTNQYAWPGRRATATQARVFPRIGATLADGTAVDDETIPRAVVYAVCEAAVYDLNNPGKLTGATIRPSDNVKKEEIGDLKFEYFEPSSWTDNRTLLTTVQDLLSEILVPERKGCQSLMFAAGRGDTAWE